MFDVVMLVGAGSSSAISASNVTKTGGECSSVIPRLTKIIRSGITIVSRNVISRRFL